MIFESSYWKDDLIKQAAVLRRRQSQQRWPDVSLARLEQSIMLGCYSIRKLSEASKLSDDTVAHQIDLLAFPWSGKPVTLMNWHKNDQLYDLSNPLSESRKALFVCNQLIHSYVFSPLFNEDDSLRGILFTSDRHRHQRLYCVALDQIIALFEAVGRDYPNEARMVYNAERCDYDVSSRMRR